MSHKSEDEILVKKLKSIKDAGTSAYALGWLLITLLSIMTPLLGSSGDYDGATLTTIWIIAIPYSAYFIWSGKRIKYLKGNSIGPLLLANAVLSLLLIQGVIPLIVSIQSLIAYFRFRKLSKTDFVAPSEVKSGKINIKEIVIFVVIVLLGSILSISNLTKDKNTDSMPSSEVQSLNQVYVSTEHGFEAIFSSSPTIERESVDVQGHSVPQTYYSNGNDDKYLAVLVTDYPSEFDLSDTKARLQGALNGSAQTINGSITSSTFGVVEGYDAIDGEISGSQEGTPVKVEIRDILVGKRMYTLIAVGETEGEYATLRNSFKLR